MKKEVLTIVALTTTIILGGVLYAKAHTIRYCKVIQEHDKIVTVLHENGEIYDFFALDSGEYIEDTVVKVSFNELKFDTENYSVNAGNPTPVFVTIENR